MKKPEYYFFMYTALTMECNMHMAWLKGEHRYIYWSSENVYNGNFYLLKAFTFIFYSFEAALYNLLPYGHYASVIYMCVQIINFKKAFSTEIFTC